MKTKQKKVRKSAVADEKQCTAVAVIEKQEKNTVSDAGKIMDIPMGLIVPSTDNPRTFTDDSELDDLIRGIAKNGLINPVTVRKIKDSDKYQLIAGERRYRACAALKHENILCHVKECDDEQALDVMMEENLNRQDLRPLDEARKYQVLIWDKKYTVKDVAFRFGLKEQYVYSRLALLDLIPEIASLVEKEEISLSVANEIAKYSPELQKEIHFRHLDENGNYQNWKELSSKAIRDRLKNEYSALLNQYPFDKTECVICKYNSEVFSMFPDMEKCRCQNQACLHNKQNEHVVSRIFELAKENPEMAVNMSPAHDTYGVKEKLKEYGVPVEEEFALNMPAEPLVPEEANYQEKSDYERALTIFEDAQKKYCEKLAEIENAVEQNTAKLVIDVSGKEPEVKYIRLKPVFEETKEKPQEDTRTAEETEAQRKEKEKMEKENMIQQLQEQDKWYQEMREECIHDDVVAFLKHSTPISKKLHKFETTLLYHILLGNLRPQSYEAFEIDDASVITQSPKTRFKIADKLTSLQMNLIIRDTIIQFLITNRFANRAPFKMKFMKMHFAEKLRAIQEKYTKIYEEKHKKIEEKLRILMPETEPEEAVIVAEQEAGTEEGQPENSAAANEVADTNGVEQVDYIEEENVAGAMTEENESPFDEVYINSLPSIINQPVCN